MEASAFRLRVPPKFSFVSALSRKPEEQKAVALKNVERYPSNVQRRMILRVVGINLTFANFRTALAVAVPVREVKEQNDILNADLNSKVRVLDIIEGEGQEARDGDTVEFNYVCRRSNGYFVHSTIDQFSGESSPVTLRLCDGQIIEGLKEVLVGMKVGGKRRALVPPSLGYVNASLQPIPEEFGPRRSLLSHAREPLVFEVQLLRVL